MFEDFRNAITGAIVDPNLLYSATKSVVGGLMGMDSTVESGDYNPLQTTNWLLEAAVKRGGNAGVLVERILAVECEEAVIEDLVPRVYFRGEAPTKFRGVARRIAPGQFPPSRLGGAEEFFGGINTKERSVSIVRRASLREMLASS